MTFRLSPRAEADLAEIAHFIARDDPAAARRWLARIERLCRRLGEFPGLGVARDDIRRRLRLIAAEDYLVLYRAGASGVEIVRVLHGARRWQDLL